MGAISQNAVATVASQIKKPTKATAHAHLMELVDELATQEQTAKTHEALSALYAFFIPKAPAKPKTDFQWAAKAVAKNDARYYLNYVYVDEENIVGTDGHRLHIAKNTEGLAPGFYDTAGTHLYDPSWARFPNYKRVIPACENRGDYDQVVIYTGKQKIVDEGDRQCFDLGVELGTYPMKGPRVNRKYYLEAVSMEKSEGVVGHVAGDSDSVRLDLPGDRTVVIMPVRK